MYIIFYIIEAILCIRLCSLKFYAQWFERFFLYCHMLILIFILSLSQDQAVHVKSLSSKNKTKQKKKTIDSGLTEIVLYLYKDTSRQDIPEPGSWTGHYTDRSKVCRWAYRKQNKILQWLPGTPWLRNCLISSLNYVQFEFHSSQCRGRSVVEPNWLPWDSAWYGARNSSIQQSVPPEQACPP